VISGSIIEGLTKKPVFYGPEDMYNFKRLVGRSNFMLDTGHANVEGISGFSMAAIRDSPHVHIHDNDGTNDSHFGLGRSNID